MYKHIIICEIRLLVNYSASYFEQFGVKSNVESETKGLNSYEYYIFFKYLGIG